MAYVNPNAPDEQGQEVPQQGQSTATGGAGVAGATGGKAAAKPGVNVPAQPSAQLSAYLAANQPQTTQFAEGIANTVGGQVNAAGAAIQPAVNTYTGSLYRVPTDASINQSVATSPSSLTPEQQATYKTALEASSKSPNPAATFASSSPYQDLTSGVEKAVATADLWNKGNSVADLTEALRPFTSPSATAGDRTLDSLLVSQTPSAYSKIKTAVAPAANLRGNLQAGSEEANAALRNAIETNQATTDAARGAGTSYAANLKSYLDSAVANLRQSASADAQRLASNISRGELTEADDALLGITKEQGDQLAALAAAANEASTRAGFDAPLINLGAYLAQKSPNLISGANTATAKDYADVEAIRALLGDQAPALALDSTTTGQAGQTPNLNALDYESATNAADISKRVAELQIDAKEAASAGAAANSGWAYNHFGGQSPEGFNNYINGLNARIAADNAEIQKLIASAPTIPTAGGVSEATGEDGQLVSNNLALSNPVLFSVPWAAEQAAKNPTDALFAANPVMFAPVKFADQIGSVARNIGGWLGFSEGGQVPANGKRKA